MKTSRPHQPRGKGSATTRQLTQKIARAHGSQDTEAVKRLELERDLATWHAQQGNTFPSPPSNQSSTTLDRVEFKNTEETAYKALQKQGIKRALVETGRAAQDPSFQYWRRTLDEMKERFSRNLKR